MPETTTPKIGCVLIIKNQDGKIALILRQNTGWMDGKFALPGGKIERRERYMAAAIREAQEELGITILQKDLEFSHLVQRNDAEEEWLCIAFKVNAYDGEPYNKEPDMHGNFAWFDPKELPENIILSDKIIIQSMDTNAYYTELDPEAFDE